MQARSSADHVCQLCESWFEGLLTLLEYLSRIAATTLPLLLPVSVRSNLGEGLCIEEVAPISVLLRTPNSVSST